MVSTVSSTQRLPRLVGLSKALEMMLTSKPIKGSEAHSLGLVDAIVPANELLNTARSWALEMLERRKPWVSSLYKTDKLEPLGEAREILKFARSQAHKQAPNLIHPLVCIDVIEEGIASGPRAGLWKEADAFDELLRSDTCKSLVHIFSAQRANSKVPGVTDLGLAPRKIRKVAILGGGLMGSGIATALILSNYPVILKEVNDKFLQAGLGRVKENLQSRVKKGRMTQEKFEMKQAIVDVLDLGKKIKKTPIIVGNCTGFAVNRMFFPYTQAAILLVERGTDLYKIDRAITKFGMPMGPFRLADLVGFGVAIATAMQYIEHFPDRTYKSMIVPLMQEDKRAGEATRKGFYLYDDRRKASPDPEIKKYIEKAREISGVSIDPKIANLPEEDIVEMIFFPVVNEACRVLAEGIAVKASDLDIAAVMGMGFPPYRGGILFWADMLGSKYIYSRLEEWSKLYGGFFKPCAYMAEKASKGAPLSSGPMGQLKSRL